MKGSKKEERMMVLEMLSAGTISVDESIKLLGALDSCKKNDGFEYSSGDMDEKFERFTTNLDNFAKDVSEKAKTTYKDLEPKIKSGTRTVIGKTISVLDDINCSLTESLENMKRADAEECAKKECDEERDDFKH